MEREKMNDLFAKHLGPIQNNFEFSSLVNYLEGSIRMVKPAPTGIIEVGVATGGTFRFWRELLAPGGKIIGVDTNHRTDVIPNSHYIEPLQKEFSEDKRVNFVIGDSTSGDTIRRVSDILNGELVDFIFIDANHTTKYVTQDYENYSKFVRIGGYICFHDITNPCIRLLWEKLVGNMDFAGYCEFWAKNRPMGIGVIKKEG